MNFDLKRLSAYTALALTASSMPCPPKRSLYSFGVRPV
jgi:hypothetical protein